jgi:ABC-type multidrug transport system ATPase subunit
MLASPEGRTVADTDRYTVAATLRRDRPIMSLLHVDSVSVRYWRGRHVTQVLEDVSLEAGPGELCGIWGDRSAGKTTLARVVVGAQGVDRGRVVFDGAVLADPHGLAGGASSRAEIGFASRVGPRLEDLSVEEWIASRLVNSHRWRRAVECARVALAQVGVADAADEQWQNLSNSEQMLVSIAQAIVRRPRLLVVDDPVAGLGVEGRANVMGLLRAIADQGVAVVITAADVAELRGADRIWALEAGRLSGPPAPVLGTLVHLRPAGA